MSALLQENLTFDAANIVLESNGDEKEKSLYMKGLFIEGDTRNANQRIYPREEIRKAVETINSQISNGYSVLGEVDHPADLQINLDRVSHMIESMWCEGANGYGKLKIIPTPMGKMVTTMLNSGVKLGVSSRGSGNVNEATGSVSEFEIITVDIVAMPSAPNAYPKAIYESLMNMRGGMQIANEAEAALYDRQAQRYLAESVKKFIKELRLK